MTTIPVYKTTNVQEILAEAGTGALPHIPAGEYKGVILKSEMKSTKDNQGQYLQLDIIITEGSHRDTEFAERLNLVNNNQTAVKIAYETLARISEAVGLSTLPTESTQLHNKPFLFKVVDEEGKPYMDNNGVQQMGKPRSAIDSRGYKSIPKVGDATAGATQMPWQQ